LAQYKKSGIPSTHSKKKHAKEEKSKFQASMDNTKDAVEAYSDSKGAAKVSTVDERICAADVSGVLARMGYVAASISHLTAECRLVVDQRANCAGDISRLLAAVAMTASSGAEISASCTDYEKYIGADIAPYQYTRRLKGEDHLATLPVQAMFDGVEAMKTAHQEREAAAKARDFQLTTCVTASWFAATFFARFLDMSPAIKHCGEHEGPQCAASIIDILASLSWTASSISYAVSECPVQGQHESAFCAAGITKLVAAVADMAAALSIIAPTCISKNATDTEGYAGVRLSLAKSRLAR